MAEPKANQLLFPDNYKFNPKRKSKKKNLHNAQTMPGRAVTDLEAFHNKEIRKLFQTEVGS